MGSNQGDRRQSLTAAVRLLGEIPGTHIVAVADFLETAPVDAPPGSGPFLNTAAHLRTALDAAELFARMLAIEQTLGRHRDSAAPGARNGPRTIDLDLLLFDDRVIRTPELTVPHTRMHMRRFVLEPLAQIAPEALHPTTGRTIRELLVELTKKDPPAATTVAAGAPSVVPGPGGAEK